MRSPSSLYIHVYTFTWPMRPFLPLVTAANGAEMRIRSVCAERPVRSVIGCALASTRSSDGSAFGVIACEPGTSSTSSWVRSKATNEARATRGRASVGWKRQALKITDEQCGGVRPCGVHVGVVRHILPVGQNACGYFSAALPNAHVRHITRKGIALRTYTCRTRHACNAACNAAFNAAFKVRRCPQPKRSISASR